MDLVVSVDFSVPEQLDRYSEDDLARLVLAEEAIHDLISTRLPSNDFTTRENFYADFGPALVLDVLALRSIVDTNLAHDPASRSGQYHYW